MIIYQAGIFDYKLSMVSWTYWWYVHYSTDDPQMRSLTSYQDDASWYGLWLCNRNAYELVVDQQRHQGALCVTRLYD